jgi:rhamnose utilization protein RhaD (predicted bifunctional aldolase and dehydrogenase)
MSLAEITELSHFYGANPDYVIAGGGNTSYKDNDTIWIKGSGTSLGDIKPEGFVAMDRAKLAAIWKTNYPAGAAEREAAVLADMMAAKKPGEEKKRPSVETLLHDMLPYKYVVHTHPSLVNGVTCSQKGEAALRELFGAEPVWVPISDPGFVLAVAVKQKLSGKQAPRIFLQNHGVFVGADSPEEIKKIYADIMGKIEAKIKRRPDFGGASNEYENSKEIEKALAAAAGFAAFLRNNEIKGLVKDRDAFKPLSSAYTPDHIVYSGSDPLFLEKGEDPAAAYKAHAQKYGKPPKIAAAGGLGIYGLGNSQKNAALALELFCDAVKVACYAESFGGPLFMTAEKIAFINNWEAESYRAKQT